MEKEAEAKVLTEERVREIVREEMGRQELERGRRQEGSITPTPPRRL